jgi:hypothetical protein
MYLPRTTFDAGAALVVGYDLACSGGALRGFREWLIPRIDDGNNLAWPALVLRQAFPATDAPDAKLVDAAAHLHALDTMFSLLLDFEVICSGPRGLRRIFREYERWLGRQPWHQPGSPSWLED